MKDNMIQILPANLSGLPKLTTLDVGTNQLEDLPFLSCLALADSCSLTYLDLSHNHISTLPKEIGALTSLSDLILSHNSLRNLPIELAEINTLLKLHIDGNPLTHLEPALRRFVGDEIELISQLSTSLFGDAGGRGADQAPAGPAARAPAAPAPQE